MSDLISGIIIITQMHAFNKTSNQVLQFFQIEYLFTVILLFATTVSKRRSRLVIDQP